MDIRTFWFLRKGEDTPELLVAWDESSVYENPEGYDKNCLEVYEQVKQDDSGAGPRQIRISVPSEAIEGAFRDARVAAIVKE